MTKSGSVLRNIRRLSSSTMLLAPSLLLPIAPIFAQTVGADLAPQQAADIIVTATKQDVAVSKVPISIGVVTRDAIDGQSLRTVEDLSRVTPGLFITNSNGPNGSLTVAIRGLASQVGAPTVGVYLDDIPITRRNAGGAYAGNGTNFPQLFDLDHVEVLRGPQGTLYGGSSIGGTLKFILPQPSLNATHVRAKAEVATTKDGAPSYELGLSTSTPLVTDKIGLTASIYGRRNGGWIDHVSRYTGAVLEPNTNSQVSYSGRIAILLKPTEDLSIQPGFYGSYDRFNDQDIFWTNSTSYTQPAFTTPSTAASPTINGRPFTHPAFTFPNYNVFGPYRTGVNCNVGANFAGQTPECVQKARRVSKLYLPSLTLGYDLGGANLKSITSYTRDIQTGNTPSSYEDLNLFTQLGGRQFVQDLPTYASNYFYTNKRTGWTQEVRLATDPSKRLSFVAGGFYSQFRTTSDYALNSPQFGDALRVLFNQTALAKYKVDSGANIFLRNQVLREKELAAFGEATFKVTDHLSVTGGLRLSKVTFGFSEAQYGTTSGRAVAIIGNGLTQGSVTNKPISPKVAVQYTLDGRNMIYASATKGFRAGGVAARPAGAACDAELTAMGFGSATAQPYKSDSVWSYELGAKVRPFGDILSVDASIYRVDWNNAQVNYRLQCGLGYVANAGKARSQGVDLSAQLHPISWLTLNGNLSYVDAYYDGLTFTNATTGATSILIQDGDRQPIPKWSYTIGGQVTVPVREGLRVYARADYQYAGKYPRSFGPLTASFFPDVYIANATHYASARIGATYRRFDISLFMNNLFNSQDVTSVNFNAGRGGCTVQSPGVYVNCTRNSSFAKETSFRPRTIGLTGRFSY